jgi:hypothetical protein
LYLGRNVAISEQQEGGQNGDIVLFGNVLVGIAIDLQEGKVVGAIDAAGQLLVVWCNLAAWLTPVGVN